MKDSTLLGVRVPPEELVGLFDEAEEGSIQLIYGRIRQGKSTRAVHQMLEQLELGAVVYSNMLLDLDAEEFDERLRIASTFWALFLPGTKGRRFYRFDKANYHYFDPVEGTCDGRRVFDPHKAGAEVAWLNTLTDCRIYYDEGQWLLDSYEKTDVSVSKRKLITESGHVGRTMVIIAQRTQSVHVNARGNVNQFFRCSKRNFLGLWTVLMVEEFQDMKGNDVDEDAEPVSVQRYWFNGRAWRAFNTHYLRRGRPASQSVHFEAFDLSYNERLIANVNALRALFPFLKKGEERAPRAPAVRSWESRGAPPLGVESDSAALKSGERLNTVPAGGKSKLSALDRADIRARAQAARDNIEIPF